MGDNPWPLGLSRLLWAKYAWGWVRRVLSQKLVKYCGESLGGGFIAAGYCLVPEFSAFSGKIWREFAKVSRCREYGALLMFLGLTIQFEDFLYTVWYLYRNYPRTSREVWSCWIGVWNRKPFSRSQSIVITWIAGGRKLENGATIQPDPQIGDWNCQLAISNSLCSPDALYSCLMYFLYTTHKMGHKSMSQCWISLEVDRTLSRVVWGGSLFELPPIQNNDADNHFLSDDISVKSTAAIQLSTLINVRLYKRL